MTRRQLITSDEATIATKQHKKPCSDCPLARTSLQGWLGGTGTPDDWTKALHSESPMRCHTLEGAQCAGAAIYRANVLKRPRPPNLVLEADKKLVFANPTEFINHHGSKPKP